MKILKVDSRNDCPRGQLVGVYHVAKKNTIARFTFGKPESSFKTINEAFVAMSLFVAKRNDAGELSVTLLNNHW